MRLGAWEYQQDITGVFIYHLLRGTLGEKVTVAQIVHFDVLDVISVRDVDPIVELSGGMACRGYGFDSGARGLDRVSHQQRTWLTSENQGKIA